MFFGWIGGNGDFDSVLFDFLSCENVGGFNCVNWCNKEFDVLFGKVWFIYDFVEWVWFYEEVLKIVCEEVFLVLFVYFLNFVVMFFKVVGVILDFMGWLDFSCVLIVK